MKTSVTKWCQVTVIILGVALAAPARGKKTQQSSLSEYLEKLQGKSSIQVEAPVPGGVWTPSSEFSRMASDIVARKLNDTIVIQIMDETLAEATGAVTTQRNYTANSAVGALPGKVNVSAVNPMLDLASKEALKGSGQATSHSRLRSNLAGRVVAILPGGSMVVEASKTVAMNNEKQIVTLRGIVRPSDLTPENTVPSTRLSDLEIEVNGKGIISDSTRRPHWVLRLLTKFLTF
jgi:flagellar L-ring protein FlgH